MSESTPSAPKGLQAERTALAWLRTGLVLLVLGLGSWRLAWEHLGVWSFLPTVIVVSGAIVVMALARRRYRAADDLLNANVEGEQLDGRAPLLVAVVALLLAVLGLMLLWPTGGN
jgi:uncharacterized membrane protein YidH (DUF202 family)